MPGGIEEDPKPLTTRLVRSEFCTEITQLLFSFRKVVDTEVEVKSTRRVRVGPPVWHMIVNALEINADILLTREHNEIRVT
ncbi:MAG: hypothetical protein OXC29_19710 [Rhodococcus sp.]|nr:hypothetical protein [Rhodococcus sp. (in: high G+C Gram-positive bacteria)]